MVILELGAGRKLHSDRINVDIVPGPGVDVVHDLDIHPWPWPDASATDVYATHIFEHVRDPLGFMEDAHRVLEVGGMLHLEVPHFESPNAFTDPTHLRFCTPDTFRYWVPDTWLSDITGDLYHRGCLFDEIRNEQIGHDLHVKLRKRP